jgi:hypothetical protein
LSQTDVAIPAGRFLVIGFEPERRERALAEVPSTTTDMFSGVISHTAEQPSPAWPKLRRVESP